jgi:hypothetical protein
MNEQAVPSRHQAPAQDAIAERDLAPASADNSSVT